MLLEHIPHHLRVSAASFLGPASCPHLLLCRRLFLFDYIPLGLLLLLLSTTLLQEAPELGKGLGGFDIVGAHVLGDAFVTDVLDVVLGEVVAAVLRQAQHDAVQLHAREFCLFLQGPHPIVQGQ